MSPRRLFYTRQEVADYCDVNLRSVIRWEGVHLTKLRDPYDPRRVVYEGTEVESWERARRRRDSGTHRIRRHGTVRRPISEARALAIAAAGAAAARAEERPVIGKTQSAPIGSTPPASPRSPEEADDALERWEREIDERKRRWEAEHGIGVEEENPPRSSGGRK
jgi:hypothetical protein